MGGGWERTQRILPGTRNSSIWKYLYYITYMQIKETNQTKKTKPTEIHTSAEEQKYLLFLWASWPFCHQYIYVYMRLSPNLLVVSSASFSLLLVWAGIVYFKDSLGYKGLKPTQTSSSEWWRRILDDDRGYKIRKYNRPHLRALSMPSNWWFFNEDWDYSICVWMQKKSHYTDAMLKIEVTFTCWLQNNSLTGF